jgi:hypothetical protein
MVQQDVSSQSGLATGLKISTILLAVGVLIQGWLGSTGFFQGEPGRIDVHAMLGNFMFLVAVIQVGIAFYAMPKGFASRNLLILAVVTVLLLVAQIGLGYSTRDSIDALAWHLPNGVLLMGVTTATAVIAWNAVPRGIREG